jgi:hypothetical protein
VGAVGAVDAVCALGAGAAPVVAEGVGGVETRPLARPRRERKISHSTPPSRDDGGVERRPVSWRTAALPATWSDSGDTVCRTAAMVTARADLREMWMRADLHAG